MEIDLYAHRVAGPEAFLATPQQLLSQRNLTTANIVKLNVGDLRPLLDDLKRESSSIASGTLGR